MKLLLLSIATFFSITTFSQDFNFKHNFKPLDEKLISNFLKFEEIDFSQNSISSKNLKNKNYIINLKEYKDGVMIKTTCLDKSDNAYYAVIDSTELRFNVLGKRKKNKYNMKLFFDRYSTKKHTFNLQSKHVEDYILKTISIKNNDLQFNKPFIFMILTTPEYHKDGSSSWCDVAANETPDKIYEKNKIPHFFIFEMTIY